MPKRKAGVYDSPNSQPDSESGHAVKPADDDPSQQVRQDKKAKKAKAQKLPNLTQSYTHEKILKAQKRLLKDQKKHEARAKARVEKHGSPKKKA